MSDTIKTPFGFCTKLNISCDYSINGNCQVSACPHKATHSSNTIYTLKTEPNREDGVYAQLFAVKDGVRYDTKVVSLKELSLTLTNSIMDGLEKVIKD